MEKPFYPPNPIEDESSLDIQSEIKRYLRYWPWFLLSVFLTFTIAYTYLRYAPRIYETNAKIKVLDESDGLELPLSASIFNGSNINLENEIEILTSYTIMSDVVRKLRLNTSFYAVGTIQTSQIDQLPFEYRQLINPDSITSTNSYEITISSTNLTVTNLNTEEQWNFSDFTSFNSNHELPFEIDFNQKKVITNIEDTYIIKFTPIKHRVIELKSQILVAPIGKQSDLLSLSLKGESTALNEAILNLLISVFNQDGIKDRQLVSQRTIDFIEDRFTSLTKELDSIEISSENFKEQNNLVDVSTDVQLGLEQRVKSEEELFRLENQLLLAQSLENSLNIGNDSDLLPANIGLENAGINDYISDYNNAVLERDKLIQGGSENNPAVQFANTQVQDLRVNIKRSLKDYTTQIQLSLNQIKIRNKEFASQMAQIPNKERLFKGIQRQQKIKESLYLLLLQKREEAAINLAITSPSIKIVDYAITGGTTNGTPVSPNSVKVYLAAIILALLIPFTLLYIIFLFDKKIYTKDDIESITKDSGSVIAEIPLLGKNGAFGVSIGESLKIDLYRNVRTNIEFELKHIKNRGKIIYVTSTIKGEGKTTNSVNLVQSYAALKRKTLLIGSDFRNPQVHKALGIQNDPIGLSSYLNGDYESVMDLVKDHVSNEGHIFNVLLPGLTPPEPAELLANGRFELALQELTKVYDYIIIDSAPILAVSDTLFIAPKADMTLYLVRSNYSEREFINISKNVEKQNKLNNIRYLLNGVKLDNLSGYKYNYGYYHDYTTSWSRQFISRLFNRPK